MNVEPNTVTRIEVGAKTVLVLWGPHPRDLEQIALLLVASTNTLFLGMRTLAAAVRLTTGEIVDAHEVFATWSFQQTRGYVLEQGELACYLRAETGEVLAEAAVDPPYDLFETDEGIRFESICVGEQWLRFPA